MDDETGRIKSYLLRDRIVTRDQFSRVESYANKENVSLLKALTDLKLISPTETGNCLSAVHELPYKPLLPAPPPEQARSMLSLQCASRWNVFPADYDAKEHILTLAVQDPKRIPMFDHIHQFLLQHHTLAFVIAPENEIRQAIETYLADKPMPAPELAKSPEIEKAAGKPDEPRKPLKLSGLHSEGATPVPQPIQQAAQEPSKLQPQRTTVKYDGSEPAYTREDMSRALISAATILTTVYLESKIERFALIRERVRYCQLLASRLRIPPMEMDRLLFAAWLSGVEDRPQLIKQFANPYDVEKVLSPDDKSSPASFILSLVKSYQELKLKDPPSCGEVNILRKKLGLVWSCPAEHNDMLETFLQLRMDEEFLDKAGHSAGRILIVALDETSAAGLAAPLTNDGYQVHLVSTTEAALDFVALTPPDVMVVEIDQSRESGLKLCQKIKRSSETSRMPILAVMAQKTADRVADCLRSGADDFLVKPFDLELLLLKTRKLMPARQTAGAKTGVNGSLDDMSFTDMIQILSAGGKNLEIVLTREGQEGSVFVKNGEIVHAVLGEAHGEDAFYRLMQWKKGGFTTKQCAEFPARTIQLSIMSLLMEGTRLGDEGLIQDK